MFDNSFFFRVGIKTKRYLYLQGSYSGNAAGFKLASLIKLSELKSNKHNITLLHVIMQVNKRQLKLFFYKSNF